MTTRLLTIEQSALSLEMAKLHCKVDHDDEDLLIQLLIGAAQDLAGQATGRSIAKAVWRLQLDAFPCGDIRLLMPPLVEVQDVEYRDADGAPQTLDAGEYAIDPHSEPGRLVSSRSGGWPPTAPGPGAVSVTYVAGYGAGCPEPIQQWMLLNIGHWYRNRESVHLGQFVSAVPYVDGLLDRFRIWSV